MYTLLSAILGGKNTGLINPTNASDFQIAAYICTILGFICSLGYYFLIKIPAIEEITIDTQSNQQNSLILLVCQLWNQLKTQSYWLRKLQLYQIAIIYSFTCAFITLTKIYIPFYIQVRLFFVVLIAPEGN